jgi:membrane fusion protein, adhesin transport system
MVQSRSPNMVLWLVITFMSLAVVWVYFAEVDEVIRAPGVVEPKGQVQKVQSRSAGKIATIDIGIGDKVVKGQVLLRLDDEEAASSVTKNQITLDNLMAEIVRLGAEISGSSSKIHIYDTSTIDWPSGVSEKAREIQSKLFNLRMSKLAQQRRVLAEELSQLENTFIEKKQLVEGQKSMLALKEKEKGIYKPLVDQGAEPAMRLVSISQQIQEIKNKIANNKIKLDGIKIEIQTLAEREKEVVASHKAAAFDALAPKRVEFEITKAETLALQKRLADSQLTAPIDGIITKVHPSGPGTIVNAGADLVELVPISNKISILAKLPTKDVASIKAGQNTRISLDSYDFTTYGTIPSYINKIAQNTTTDESGNVYYEVWIKTKGVNFSKSDVVPQIIPGMLAQVEITGEKRTVLEYLMKPVLETTAVALTEK